jgi:C4-dicarboxylate-specific signal transduction histidine kinase
MLPIDHRLIINAADRFLRHLADSIMMSGNTAETACLSTQRSEGLFAKSAMGLVCLSLMATSEAQTWSLQKVFVPNSLLVGIATLLLVQTAMIVVLLVQNHRQRALQDQARRQQSDLTHAARLVLVGEMTASIAHEVSQPLSAILSNADAAEMLLCAEPPALGEVRQILEDIRRDDLRAHGIVCNLRRLLAKRELTTEIMDLNEVVLATVALAASDAAKRNVSIRDYLDPSLPRVAGDPIHLQQVILNLMINGMEAMADIKRGDRTLSISTRVHSANKVVVSVIDSGCGLAPEVIPHLFDSFFSTKREGMGLGLSIARTIVQSHGGEIWAEPRSEHGTEFRFTVPIATVSHLVSGNHHEQRHRDHARLQSARGR